MSTPAQTALYYDGACPICSREIAQYRRTRGAENLAFVDVTACDQVALGPNLTRDDALARMHVRLADGTLVSGAAAFAAIWRELPSLAWAGRIASLPFILPALELGYTFFLLLRPLWRHKK